MTYTITHKKNSLFWKIVGIAIIGTAIGFFLPSLFSSHYADANGCTGVSGNLEGYINTENIGPIYVSKASWDAEHRSNPADVDFYVSYDTKRNLWSGRGWNEEVGWVDFDYDQQGRKVRFVAPGEEYDRLHDSDPNNDEPVEWGNWRGVADLSSVNYNVQTSQFEGVGNEDDASTGEGDRDERIGSGEWTFDNVVLIKPDCPERLNLLFRVNGTLKSSYHKDTCPIKEDSLILQWTSEGVKDCKSIAGPWDLVRRDSQNTGTRVHNTSPIEEGDRAIFKLQCKGSYTGADIVRSVVASCGEECNGPECDPENGLIVPKIIEA